MSVAGDRYWLGRQMHCEKEQSASDTVALRGIVEFRKESLDSSAVMLTFFPINFLLIIVFTIISCKLSVEF